MTDAKFWDRIARKYSKDPIKNMTAYEATLTRVAARLKPQDRVLEVGCGTGTTALRLAGGVAHYTGADLSPGMIEIAREKLAADPVEGLEFTAAPANKTRFDAEAYDAVLGFNVLHLLEDLPATLARAHGLLKPGGLLITKTPCLGDMTFFLRILIPLLQLVGKAPFVALFSASELETAIQMAGFEIEESRTFEGAPNSRYLVARRP